jgi:hypothetical protein
MTSATLGLQGIADSAVRSVILPDPRGLPPDSRCANQPPTDHRLLQSTVCIPLRLATVEDERSMDPGRNAQSAPPVPLCPKVCPLDRTPGVSIARLRDRTESRSGQTCTNSTSHVGNWRRVVSVQLAPRTHIRRIRATPKVPVLKGTSTR